MGGKAYNGACFPFSNNLLLCLIPIALYYFLITLNIQSYLPTNLTLYSIADGSQLFLFQSFTSSNALAWRSLLYCYSNLFAYPLASRPYLSEVLYVCFLFLIQS